MIGGGYGSYTALKLAIPSDLTFPATVKVTAKGYHDLTVEIAKETVSYNDVYTATIRKLQLAEIQRLHTQRWQRKLLTVQ